jgi:hypothetical protein
MVARRLGIVGQGVGEAGGQGDPDGPGHVGWLLHHGGVVWETNCLFDFWLTLLVNDNGPPLPLFFKSVDFKGTLSCLGSTLLEVLILKGLEFDSCV